MTPAFFANERGEISILLYARRVYDLKSNLQKDLFFMESLPKVTFSIVVSYYA